MELTLDLKLEECTGEKKVGKGQSLPDTGTVCVKARVP
jgi:hypothetical protein